MDSLAVFLSVGSLLSLMITGTLGTVERYVDCPGLTSAKSEIGERSSLYWKSSLYWRADTEALAVLCLAAGNRLATVLFSVWLPLLTFCLLRYQKTEDVSQRGGGNRRNTLAVDTRIRALIFDLFHNDQLKYI